MRRSRTRAPATGIRWTCSSAVPATFANGAGTIEWLHPEAMQEAFDVNVIAPLVMTRSLKANLEAGSRRLVIMMSTGNASLQGNTNGTLLGYRLSKTALNQAARTLAAEWGPQGFSIVALNPGWVRTDMGGPDADLSVDNAADNVLNFVRAVSTSTEVNGLFPEHRRLAASMVTAGSSSQTRRANTIIWLDVCNCKLNFTNLKAPPRSFSR